MYVTLPRYSMPSTAECDRRHRLDEAMQTRLLTPVRQLSEAHALLSGCGEDAEVLLRMCEVAGAEIGAAGEAGLSTTASVDLLEHCLVGLTDLRRCVAAGLRTVDNTRRFVAEAVVQYHDSVMPHLSDAELAVIQAHNLFVVRPS